MRARLNYRDWLIARATSHAEARLDAAPISLTEYRARQAIARWRERLIDAQSAQNHRTGKALRARDAKRDIGAELLASVREMKAGQ